MFKKIAIVFVCCFSTVFASQNLNFNPMFDDVDQAINDDVDKGFGGAVLFVIKDNKLIKRTAYGYRDMFKPECTTNLDYSIPASCYLEQLERTPMTIDTKFDLASLTKVYSTIFSMMHLVYQGKLDMNKPVAAYIDGYPYNITVKQVAEHTAGFGPEVNFYDKNDVMYDGKTVEQNGFYSQDRATTIDFITGRNDSGNNPDNLIVPDEYEPGTDNIYSDTDFMLLGIIIEKITGKSLDKYVEDEIYQPLGINLTYNPSKNGVDLNEMAQTAVGNWSVDQYGQKLPYNNMRENPIRGDAHDEKVFYSMGGVSGHAGLFGSAKDLAILVKVMLNGGSYNNVTLFNQETIDLFTSPVGTDDTYGIGWRLAGDNNKMAWMMGDYASNKAYGHTGFTGMVTVIDPEENLGIILLTNKLQSQQLSKGKFASTSDYVTPNYGLIMTMIQNDVLK